MVRALAQLTLVLGGVRSGKSAHAEALVAASGLVPVYVATAEAGDAEMAARIVAHRERRGGDWRTVEAPLALAEALAEEARPDRIVLVDCLTLWLSNVMGAGREVETECRRLLDLLAGLTGPVVLVSNEVGQGVVPIGALARAFVDHAGRLHQDIARQADKVTLVVAGLPLDLKTPSTEARP